MYVWLFRKDSKIKYPMISQIMMQRGVPQTQDSASGLMEDHKSNENKFQIVSPVLGDLVGVFSPTHLKNMLVKLDHLPR